MQTIKLVNWKFHYNDCPDAWFKGYSDESWEDVTVPHDWSVHMPFSKEYSSGTGYLAGGIGWYRTSFYLPEALKGKRVSIVFDGVYKNSQVWCNSYYLGKRPFGYATFRYDITDQVSFGESVNRISVKVDHRDIADSRWFTGSGITRKVTLVIEEPVHVDFQGVFFKTPKVTIAEAEIEIDNTIVNDTPQVVTVSVSNTLAERDLSRTFSFTESCEIPAGGSYVVTTKGNIPSPSLWSPEEPNLYNLSTIIHTKALDGSFEYEEKQEQKVGIRSFFFDPNKGFFLNEKPMKMKGVCVHHDAGCLGAAVLPEVWLRRLITLKEMGCNAIRMSHNPHMPELYDLCDSLGFLVMDEAFDEWEGVKNKWSVGHNVYPPKHQGYFEDFPEWHERDLSDLVKRDRNHPSIIMWSIGNEIDYPNDPYCHPLFTSMTGNNDKNKPAAERQYNDNRPNAERLTVIAKELTEIVKKHDTTRPVTAAVAFPELSTHLGFIDSFDVVGYNYKEQFYEQDHERFPEKPFLGSENSHSYNAWRAVTDNEYISGQFLWTGIDYLGEAHGWPIRGSRAGIITVAGYPKTSYYRRKSFWLEKAVLYLTTARADLDESGNVKDIEHKDWKPMYRSWNYVPGEMVEIRCYTNLPNATLYCNHKEIGTKTFDSEAGYITWYLPYEYGELKVVGSYDTGAGKDCNNVKDNNSVIIEDTITPTGTPCDIKLKVWNPMDTVLNSSSGDATLSKNLSLDTNNLTTLTQIEVTITDGSGNWITTDSTKLYVQVEGAGTLIGIESGDLSDCTEYSAPYRNAYEGRMILYILNSDTTGSTTVTVHGESLRTAKITL